MRQNASPFEPGGVTIFNGIALIHPARTGPRPTRLPAGRRATTSTSSDATQKTASARSCRCGAHPHTQLVAFYHSPHPTTSPGSRMCLGRVAGTPQPGLYIPTRRALITQIVLRYAPRSIKTARITPDCDAMRSWSIKRPESPRVVAPSRCSKTALPPTPPASPGRPQRPSRPPGRRRQRRPAGWSRSAFTPQHGLSSNTMALITSGCGVM